MRKENLVLIGHGQQFLRVESSLSHILISYLTAVATLFYDNLQDNAGSK